MKNRRNSQTLQTVAKKNGLSSMLYFATYAFFIIGTYLLFLQIYYVQSTPFLDEIFHVPQAQKYCEWLFMEWDPKITTLPGLYLVSIGVIVPLTSVFQVDLCDIFFLRLTNVLGCFMNFYLIYEIQRKLHSCKKEMVLLSTFNLATFPVLYFFTFFYYTDTISTTAVLLMYLLHLEGQDFLSSVIGLISVLVRQTNIIWVFLVFLETVIEVLKTEALTNKKRVTAAHQKSVKYIQILRFTLLHCWEEGVLSCVILIINILLRAGCYILIFLLFAAFVIWNGSLVMGDKTAHQPVVHFPQLFYFSLFTSFFAFSHLVTNIKSFYFYCLSHKRIVFSFVIVCGLVIFLNTLVHPYLLADNRHYSFYIWKRLYERNSLMRYILIPAYIFGIYSVFKALKDVSITFRGFYILCVALCLVPQKLLEFRYFILPYILFRLQIPQFSWRPLLAELLLYSVINAITFYLFFTYTFTWPDTPEAQRILW